MNKQQLIERAASLAKLHQQKKEAVELIFLDLDKEEKISSKHLQGIAAVNELVKDMEALEKEHSDVLEMIKKG